MENLYTFINQRLRSVVENVGFEQVLPKTPFPYATYTFVNSTPLTEGDKEDITLEIDIWNRVEHGKDTVYDLEVITKQIQNTFKNLREHYEGSFYVFQLLNKLNLKDEDVAIHRRQLRFRVRCYNK